MASSSSSSDVSSPSWAPQQEGLLQLVDLFKRSQTAYGADQADIADRLDTLSNIPDYAKYLVFTLTHLSSEGVSVRSVAGLILKNHLWYNRDKISPDSLQYIKSTILPALSLPEDSLRRTATQVVTMVMAIQGPANWPEGLIRLTELMASQTVNEAEGAYSTFAKMCEDLPSELDACEINGMKVLDILIPKFIEGSDHPEARIRMHALNCLNQFISLGSSALQNHIDAFLSCLFKRASDENDFVRKFVCQALVLILSARPDKLMPQLANVVDFMLYSTQDSDEDVAVEACEFWLQFAEDPNVQEHLAPYLPRVAPVLLKSMVYSEMDLILLGGQDDDAAVPDRAEDVKPQHYSGKSHKNEKVSAEANGPQGTASGSGNGSGQARSRAAIEGQATEEDDEYIDDDDDEDEDEDYDDDEDQVEWNLRKCAAAALDVMACHFGEQLLDILLPYLKERLFSQDWLQRESGILALGAIAEGCIGGIQPHLPTLVPFLVNSLSDPKPLVRSIACWTLGRYSSWCIADKTPEFQGAYFLPVMEGLLNMVMDNNKRVQEAGCSAFATLEEETGEDLAPYLEPVLRTLAAAFGKYQQKNLLILYDAIGTLADSVGSALSTRADYVEILMPPLIGKWSELADDDAQLVPLLECLSSVTIALGPAFAAHSPPVYNRCLKIINDNLFATRAELNKPEQDREMPDDSFVVVALDLLSGLSQGLGPRFIELVMSASDGEAGSTQLIPLLGGCITSPSAAIRQSAYALLGDLAMSTFGLLRPTIPELMPELISQIVPEPSMGNVSVCNNAAWAVGEIALRYGALADGASSVSSGSNSSNSSGPPKQPPPDFAQFVEPLIQKLIPVLLSTKSVKSLTENSAVTIGRLGLVAPELVAPHLGIFFEEWCQALWDIKDNEEKDSAFRGLCEMIKVNPNGAVKGFIFFCNAVVRWTTPSQQLNEMFVTILHGFREMSGPGWSQMREQLPEPIAVRLAERYNI